MPDLRFLDVLLFLLFFLPNPARSASLETLRAQPFPPLPLNGAIAPPPAVGPAGPAGREESPSAARAGETLSGRVTAVSDGDTLRLDSGGTELKVRLAEIDAPEKTQPFGPEARERLSSLVLGRAVTVAVTDVDRYGRLVGRVTAGRTAVNRLLVAEGFAWWYRRYSEDESLGALEDEARAARRGLWEQAEPEAPWDYRRRRRASARVPAEDPQMSLGAEAPVD